MLSFFGSELVPGYLASQGGVVQLTKSSSIAYSRDEIRVNAIAPGQLSTNMTPNLRKGKERNDKIINRTPMRRWGNSDDDR